MDADFELLVGAVGLRPADVRPRAIRLRGTHWRLYGGLPGAAEADSISELHDVASFVKKRRRREPRCGVACWIPASFAASAWTANARPEGFPPFSGAPEFI